MMNCIARIGLAAAFLIALPMARAGDTPAQPEKKGEHKAAHGGCLNALGACENGHAEVKVEGDTLKLWFVGGGSDTEKAVRVPDKEIALSVTLEGETAAKPIALKAKPNELAEEKEGDCSHFEGKADWLNGRQEVHRDGHRDVQRQEAGYSNRVPCRDTILNADAGRDAAIDRRS